MHYIPKILQNAISISIITIRISAYFEVFWVYTLSEYVTNAGNIMTNTPVVFSLSDHYQFRNRLCEQLQYELGQITIHQFPDKETLIKIDNDLKDKPVIFIVSLDNPNEKILTLLFAVETARSLGAKRIGLVAPYLAYMRQDKQFQSGEGISSIYFAKLLSTYFDWMMTIDPHLHRWHSLSDVFSIDTTLLHSTQPIAQWIKKHVERPLLIGPDIESTQWVAEIAKMSQSPFLIVEKTRMGDAHVISTIPKIELYPDHTPLLIDDIISTGVTMVETVMHIQSYGIDSIICLAVHAIFANHAYELLLKTGVTKVVTCNTIAHPTNEIDLSDLVTDAVKLMTHTV